MASGRALPGLISAEGLATTVSPTFRPLGAMIYLFSPVLILDQGDESGTVRIVFQGLDRSRYVKLLTLEIDDAVFSTVSAASVADGDSAVAVTSGLLVQGSQQAFFWGYLGKAGVIRNRHIAPGGRSRLIIDDRHYGFTLLMMALRGFA